MINSLLDTLIGETSQLLELYSKALFIFFRVASGNAVTMYIMEQKKNTYLREERLKLHTISQPTLSYPKVMHN